MQPQTELSQESKRAIPKSERTLLLFQVRGESQSTLLDRKPLMDAYEKIEDAVNR